MKRILIPSLLILIFLFTTYCEGPGENGTFSFVFMTDVHLRPEKNAPEGFKKAIEKINSLQPDIIHCNDWQCGLVPAYLKTIYKDVEQ
ncbi:MAG: glycogen/starch synthase, partial [Candidatus Aminicenantes bacterium]|nr:glycogen/starch synthase [Candidatus Aminicenantes bacterium]